MLLLLLLLIARCCSSPHTLSSAVFSRSLFAGIDDADANDADHIADATSVERCSADEFCFRLLSNQGACTTVVIAHARTHTHTRIHQRHTAGKTLRPHLSSTAQYGLHRFALLLLFGFALLWRMDARKGISDTVL
uniref:Putative secreted peptide n=1 Tax=Anopheles braziliensis TaxID=58242 RepID=A0A2M3ZND1_9DIPT